MKVILLYLTDFDFKIQEPGRCNKIAGEHICCAAMRNTSKAHATTWKTMRLPIA